MVSLNRLDGRDGSICLFWVVELHTIPVSTVSTSTGSSMAVMIVMALMPTRSLAWLNGVLRHHHILATHAALTVTIRLYRTLNFTHILTDFRFCEHWYICTAEKDRGIIQIGTKDRSSHKKIERIGDVSLCASVILPIEGGHYQNSRQMFMQYLLLLSKGITFTLPPEANNLFRWSLCGCATTVPPSLISSVRAEIAIQTRVIIEIIS